jgi:hypothetical protein
MSADFYSLKMDSSNYLPFSRSMDSPGHTVSLKSEKFEMELDSRKIEPYTIVIMS